MLQFVQFIVIPPSTKKFRLNIFFPCEDCQPDQDTCSIPQGLYAAIVCRLRPYKIPIRLRQEPDQCRLSPILNKFAKLRLFYFSIIISLSPAVNA